MGLVQPPRLAGGLRAPEIFTQPCPEAVGHMGRGATDIDGLVARIVCHLPMRQGAAR